MAAREPWHLPVLVWAGLLWTALGAADYVLTQIAHPAYVALFTEAQAAYFLGLPLWLNAVWAVGVWAGLAGAILMLARARFSATMLGVAAAAVAVLTLGLVVLRDPPMQSVTGPLGIWIMLGATAAYIVLWLYARSMHADGRLP